MYRRSATARQARSIGDYSSITPGGARISYGGSAPGSSNGSNGSGRLRPVPIGGGSVPITGNVPAYPDGTLLAAAGVTGTNPVYLMQGGQKCWIPDQNTFYAMGYNWPEVQYIPADVLSAIPSGPPVQQVTIQQTSAATPATSSSSTPSSPVYSSTLEEGATYDSSTGYYINPDGTIYIPTASTGGYSSSTPTYTATLEPGATYDASTGMYVNPDGTVYNPAMATTATATFDFTEPSTWPTWVWLALAAGGTWFVFFRGRR